MARVQPSRAMPSTPHARVWASTWPDAPDALLRDELTRFPGERAITMQAAPPCTGKPKSRRIPDAWVRSVFGRRVPSPAPAGVPARRLRGGSGCEIGKPRILRCSGSFGFSRRSSHASAGAGSNARAPPGGRVRGQRHARARLQALSARHRSLLEHVRWKPLHEPTGSRTTILARARQALQDVLPAKANWSWLRPRQRGYCCLCQYQIPVESLMPMVFSSCRVKPWAMTSAST